MTPAASYKTWRSPPKPSGTRRSVARTLRTNQDMEISFDTFRSLGLRRPRAEATAPDQRRHLRLAPYEKGGAESSDLGLDSRGPGSQVREALTSDGDHRRLRIIVGTTASDGLNLDCCVITKRVPRIGRTYREKTADRPAPPAGARYLKTVRGGSRTRESLGGCAIATRRCGASSDAAPGQSSDHTASTTFDIPLDRGRRCRAWTVKSWRRRWDTRRRR